VVVCVVREVVVEVMVIVLVIVTVVLVNDVLVTDVVVRLVVVVVLSVEVGPRQKTSALPSQTGCSRMPQPVYSLQFKHPGSCSGQASKAPLVAET